MIPLEVAGMLDDFNVGPLTLRRQSASTVNEYGEHVPGAEADIVLDPVAAYPTNMRDLSWIPAGLESQDFTTFIARVELRAELSGALPDVIEYNGRDWRVMRQKNLNAQGLVWVVDTVEIGATV